MLEKMVSPFETQLLGGFIELLGLDNAVDLLDGLVGVVQVALPLSLLELLILPLIPGLLLFQVLALGVLDEHIVVLVLLVLVKVGVIVAVPTLLPLHHVVESQGILILDLCPHPMNCPLVGMPLVFLYLECSFVHRWLPQRVPSILRLQLLHLAHLILLDHLLILPNPLLVVLFDRADLHIHLVGETLQLTLGHGVLLLFCLLWFLEELHECLLLLLLPLFLNHGVVPLRGIFREDPLLPLPERLVVREFAVFYHGPALVHQGILLHVFDPSIQLPFLLLDGVCAGAASEQVQENLFPFGFPGDERVLEQLSGSWSQRCLHCQALLHKRIEVRRPETGVSEFLRGVVLDGEHCPDWVQMTVRRNPLCQLYRRDAQRPNISLKVVLILPNDLRAHPERTPYHRVLIRISVYKLR